jgi:hypothetical protein
MDPGLALDADRACDLDAERPRVGPCRLGNCPLQALELLRELDPLRLVPREQVARYAGEGALDRELVRERFDPIDRGSRRGGGELRPFPAELRLEPPEVAPDEEAAETGDMAATEYEAEAEIGSETEIEGQEELPRTASPLALMALLGTAGAAAGYGVRRLRVR